MDLLAALRSSALSLEKNFSMEQGCTCGLDRLLNARYFVAAEVVEDNDVSRLQRWAQELAHIGKKHLTIHRSVSHHRRG